MTTNYKLIALDVDGTIRSREHPVSRHTREAVTRVREAGADVTLATGRTYLSAINASADLELTMPIATFQGAHVANPKTGEVLWHVPLTSAMTCTALSTLADRTEFDVMGYLGDDVFVVEMSEWARDYGERNTIPIRVVDAGTLESSPMTRLVVRGDDDDIELLETELKSLFAGQMYVTRSLSYFCEILHPGGGKEKALEWICSQIGVSNDETVAFGNGYNDVEMLRWAGLSVAVGDAVQEVLDVADVIAPAMEDDGVARVLDDLLARGLIG